MELGEEKLLTITENSTLTELTHWLRDEEINVWAKEVKERSSFNYEIFNNFFCFYHEKKIFFSFCFLWQFPYHRRNNLIFLKIKEDLQKGAVDKIHCYLLVALPDQPKNWVMKSERTCHIQESVLGHLLWKATFIYNGWTGYA